MILISVSADPSARSHRHGASSRCSARAVWPSKAHSCRSSNSRSLKLLCVSDAANASCDGLESESSIWTPTKREKMDYLLENLGPERFQEVCQALLINEFPGMQCFPVAQPDGGRDAVSLFVEGDPDNGFIAFQVKYVRKPLAEHAPHAWLTEVLQGEASKVSALIPKGAKRYVLITNIPGTAHPESGSIDLVQKILTDNISIPSQCWWRDDINRRLDNAWNVKWAYPEILSGPDILRSIVEKGLSEHASRRSSAIRAFLRDQYDRDTEVKFKQVELQNKLLDLFIDVPINIREPVSARHGRGFEYHVFHQVSRSSRVGPDQQYVGASTLLLHPSAQSHLRRVVIEGSPGQGKSTISQYVCQMHRQRILNQGLGDSRVPQEHRHNPVRLPLKVDCRDLSQWLSRRDPFSAEYSEQLPAGWHKSLEAFLAAQIKHYSGGVEFNVDDLHAVVGLSAVLLVFDGLDEVADITQRKDVVEHITKGINRLDEVAVSLQTIVTSRPAAFANSPGMPESVFTYLYLESITQPLIESYANKWLKARRLDGKEAADVRRILRDKLDQPHLRELARNPMQLAILLSLIQTRGGSLPDKRTHLYDNYVELFFNRESEKSPIVREYRDLLVDIHRYLAWTLHVESQTKENSGSVGADRLKQLVTEYLASEGRDPGLANELFTGMVERVVALVSRVEGTYEFEVQPLREYFAARYLYSTAPYSPPGNPIGGTLPDRFDALVRDFYWQNVARFYAGCYDKGQLPSLVDRLEELSRSPGYKYTSHPQMFAATLLSDWVLAQHQKSMKQVVALVLKGVGLRQVTSGGRYNRRPDSTLVLPVGNGNEELVERCFELLEQSPPHDYAVMLLDLIRENAVRQVTLARWMSAIPRIPKKDQTSWIKHGLRLGILGQLDHDVIDALLGDDSVAPERLVTFLRGGHARYVELSEGRTKKVIDYWLDGTPDLFPRRSNSILERFSQTLSPQRYTIAFRHRQPVPLMSSWDRMEPIGNLVADFEKQEPPEHELARKCQEVSALALKLAGLTASEWATSLDPWNELVEKARDCFGERWCFYLLANTAAGIRSKSDSCEEAGDLHDVKVPLCRRARYARLRAGATNWWETQLNGAQTLEQTMFALLILLSWCGPTVVNKIYGLIDQKLNELDANSWLKLIEGLQLRVWDSDKKELSLGDISMPGPVSDRGMVAMGCRLSDGAFDSLFLERLKAYVGEDPAVLELCQRAALRVALEDPQAWQGWLSVIARSYFKGIISERHFGYRLAHAIREGSTMPMGIAESIVQDAGLYPTELVALAEQTCRIRVAEQVTPVGSVAVTQGWFDL